MTVFLIHERLSFILESNRLSLFFVDSEFQSGIASDDDTLLVPGSNTKLCKFPAPGMLRVKVFIHAVPRLGTVPPFPH